MALFIASKSARLPTLIEPSVMPRPRMFGRIVDRFLRNAVKVAGSAEVTGTIVPGKFERAVDAEQATRRADEFL